MGRKRTRQRKQIHFYLTAIIVFIMGTTACVHLREQFFKQEGESLLEEANARLKVKDFNNARQLHEDVLRRFPAGLGDRALYGLGLIYAHPDNNNANEEKTEQAFQQILDKYHDSDYITEARIWISILRNKRVGEETLETCSSELDQIKIDCKIKDEILKNQETSLNRLKALNMDLKNQIENLKKVDISIEKKKQLSSQP